MNGSNISNAMALRGDTVFAPRFGELTCIEDGYIVVENGIIAGVYSKLPKEYADYPQQRFEGHIITQSFFDMHLHAPQYPMLGLGTDMQLLDWLNAYAFPTEARFSDPQYAAAVYSAFAAELIQNGSTAVSVFSSIHTEATAILERELNKAGVTGYVGKVNMDRNCPESLRESAQRSLYETESWIALPRSPGQLQPIITPRFAPSCSAELLMGLGELARREKLPVQSHLSESVQEIEWVKSLFPDALGYWHTYDSCGLFTNGALMAHCVYSDAAERAAMRKNGVFAVHCPCSNLDIASGIAPVRRFIDEGIPVLLGSDIAGGASLFMPRVITCAVRVSKLNWLASDKKEPFLTVAEGFYLGASAGQERLGMKAGFAVGEPLHAIAVRDNKSAHPLSLEQRFERLLYLMEPKDITAVWSAGRRVK